MANISLWLVNTTLGAAIFTAEAAPWPLTGAASWIAGFLILDFLVYLAHRVQHAVSMLWVWLHAVHHSDPQVDATTSLRHAPTEWMANGVFYLGVILLLGIPVPVVAAYGVAVFSYGVFNHANRVWAPWLERVLQPVLLTRDLHMIHHSRDPEHFNCDFGGLFSIYDHLFGTFLSLPAAEVDRLDFGVDGVDGNALLTPFQLWRHG